MAVIASGTETRTWEDLVAFLKKAHANVTAPEAEAEITRVIHACREAGFNQDDGFIRGEIQRLLSAEEHTERNLSEIRVMSSSAAEITDEEIDSLDRQSDVILESLAATKRVIAECRRLAAEGTQYRRECEELTLKLKGATERGISLANEHGVLRAAHDELGREVERFKAQVESLTKERDDGNVLVSNLRLQIEDANRVIASELQNVRELTASFAGVEAELKRLKKDELDWLRQRLREIVGNRA